MVTVQAFKHDEMQIFTEKTFSEAFEKAELWGALIVMTKQEIFYKMENEYYSVPKKRRAIMLKHYCNLFSVAIGFYERCKECLEGAK